MFEPESIQSLEIEALLSELEALAATPLGAERVRAVRPLGSRAEAVLEARRIDEYRRLLQAGLDAPLRPAEVREVFLALDKDGLVLRPLDLAQLLRLLESFAAADRLLRAIEDAPALATLVVDLPSLPGLFAGLVRVVDEEGSVLDDASPLLASVRGRRRSMQERLDRAVDRFFALHKLAGERIATMRDDRTVVAVKSDLAPGRLGIVHGRSGSGATLYVEPFELVGLNNEAIELRDEEDEEIERLLAEWTTRARAASPELAAAARLVGAVDFARARALLARRIGGAGATASDDGSITLEQARHPLLVLERLGRGLPIDCVVALDLELGAGETLVITGPNTGGKTVALKTVGLSVLLFHCGLPVAAARARLPFLSSLFVDIGDAQSIAESLSTFSGHVRRVAKPLQALRTPSLVLLDELGAGTDPREGAALAVAVIERLRRLGSTTIVTSHLEALKRYALATEGVRPAAVEFDEATLSPTYRLLIDRTGASNALVIAERLGVPEEVLAEARAILEQSEGGEERMLRRIEIAARVQDQREAELTARSEALAEEAARIAARQSDLERREAEARTREQGRKGKLRAEFETRLRAAVAELQREGRERILALGDTNRKTELKLQTGLMQAAARVARAAGESETLEAAAPQPASAGGAPRTGDRVRVARFGVIGQLIEIAGERAVVAVSGKRLEVSLRELERLAPEARPRGEVRLAVEERAAAATELKIIGQRVEEATAMVDKFLDDAVLARLGEVRIVHGHGTGRLKKGVHEHLKGHALVRSLESEPEGGATRVFLEV